MKASIIVSFIASLALPAIAQPANHIPAQAAPPSGSTWSIDLFGLKGEFLGNFTIQLLDENGNWSCGGPERKARLVKNSVRSLPLAKEFETKGYFPTYRADGARLTIQFSHYCDYGLFLSGKFTAQEGKGDYVESKRGSGGPLGTFKAKRLQR